jgi:hypothetical protein
MSGWKTKGAAFLSIVYGLAGWALGLHDADTGMQFTINGMALLGVGHKIQKAGEAYANAKNDDIAAVVRRNTER